MMIRRKKQGAKLLTRISHEDAKDLISLARPREQDDFTKFS